MSFCGFKTAAMAQHVIQHLHHSYAQTCKLTIEAAFAKQQSDAEHRPWSKHSKGSSKYESIHGKKDEPGTQNTNQQIETTVAPEEQQVMDLKKQEFLSAMGVADKPKFWQNDDGGAIVNVDRVATDEIHAEGDDETSDDDTSNAAADSDDEEEEADALISMNRAAHGTVVSDRDFLKSKTIAKEDLNSDDDDEDDEDDLQTIPMKEAAKNESSDEFHQ
jgi:hypothetical protein